MGLKESKYAGRPTDIPDKQHVLTHCKLYTNVNSDQWPLIYASGYNITAFGVEKLHVFDSTKWRNIKNFLVQDNMVFSQQFITPIECTDRDLLVVHTKEYLESLKLSLNVAKISEIPFVALMPNALVQTRLLGPLRLQTGGSILAGRIAVVKGWAMNIGGGFHHCSAESGGGFCAYADITLLIKYLGFTNPEIERILIVDLDAHQGNGYARDLFGVENVHILDIYNAEIYPNDREAKQRIDTKVELLSHVKDRKYLSLVYRHVGAIIKSFQPQFIVYNAGTDILNGDPLGHLDITGPGIVSRDEIVFSAARSNQIPIVMLTSGGYQRQTARIIANSLINLRNKDLISGPPPALL